MASPLTYFSSLPFNGTSLLIIISSTSQVEWRGLTGRIELKEGRRVQFKLDLMRLKQLQHSIVKVGEWTPETRLNITDRSVFFDASPMNVTLVAITILVSPQSSSHEHACLHHLLALAALPGSALCDDALLQEPNWQRPLLRILR